MTTTPALNDDLAGLMCRLRAIDEAAMYEAPATTKATVDEAAAALEAQSKEIEALRAALEDGDNVHLNMLRGTIAKPSVEQIVHIYPEIAGWRDALRRLVNPAPGVRALPAWVYGIVNAALKEGA